MGLTLASDSRIVFAGRLICLKLNLLLWHLLALIDISNTHSVSTNSPLPLVAAHRLQACDQRWQMNRKWAISSGLQNDSIAKTIVLALWSCRICMQIRRSHKFLPSSRTFRQRCWPSCASSCISQFASTRASSGVPPITRESIRSSNWKFQSLGNAKQICLFINTAEGDASVRAPVNRLDDVIVPRPLSNNNLTQR